MPKLNLNDYKKPKEVEDVLEVTIGDGIYNIPLGNILPVKEYKALRKAQKAEDEDAISEFLARYLGEEVVDTLTMEQLTAIYDAWGKATLEACGQTTGES